MTTTMTYYCDKCGYILDSSLVCYNTDHNNTGVNCPLYGIPQSWQTMENQEIISSEVKNGDIIG